MVTYVFWLATLHNHLSRYAFNSSAYTSPHSSCNPAWYLFLYNNRLAKLSIRENTFLDSFGKFCVQINGSTTPNRRHALGFKDWIKSQTKYTTLKTFFKRLKSNFLFSKYVWVFFLNNVRPIICYLIKIFSLNFVQKYRI